MFALLQKPTTPVGFWAPSHITCEGSIAHDVVHIILHPRGLTVDVERGTPLRDVLFPYGVEFPCGGIGECQRCRVRVLSGNLPITPEQRDELTPDQLDAGWRLSCCCSADENLTLELAQWEAQILTDDTRFEFVPREGFGIAIDLGTTTLAAQLLDLTTANVIAVETALNSQAQFGSDLMSRINHAVAHGKRTELKQIIRAQLGELVTGLLKSAGIDGRRVVDIVIVGNAAMHHLFCGLDLVSLSQYPFVPSDPDEKHFRGEELGWFPVPDANVRFLPCIGGFVGSDILAGVRACHLRESEDFVGLIDLGTNGEIVLGNRERLVCCSTAAGPAFEASSLSMGMRAITGAITQVRVENRSFACHVAGGGKPSGICGSGIVDAVAAALDLGVVASSGKIADGSASITLAEPVAMTQRDIREVQVAKAAIAAGVRILLDELGISLNNLSRLSLAGAFGNYVNRVSAHRIGLLAMPPSVVQPSGNTALLGAKLALYDIDGSTDSELARCIQHIPLNAHPKFQDVFVEEMTFPDLEV